MTEPYVAISGHTEIPLRNVWLLLLYASEFYGVGPESFDGIEEYPDQLPDLLGQILVSSVESRLRKPLSTEFIAAEGDLRRVRGRIDVLRTTSHQLLRRGQVACRFEELTVDTPTNRTAYAALTWIAPLVKSDSLARACRGTARALANRGVLSPYTSNDAVAAQKRLTRNDAENRRMLLAAKLALQLTLPAEVRSNTGHQRKSLSIEEFRRLFEQAVGGFYAANLRPSWSVRRGQGLSWHPTEASPGLESLLPVMKTDIILNSVTLERRIVIDTKFASIVKKGQYGKFTFKSGHLYQLYTYVRSQEDGRDALSLSTEGLLLYPSTGLTICESFTTSGHRFTAATIDLNQPSVEVRNQLLSIVGSSRTRV